MAHTHTDNAADAHTDNDGHGHCHGGHCHCHNHNHGHDHNHDGSQEGWRGFMREIISGVLLAICLVLEHTGAFASMGAAMGVNAAGFDWLPMTAYLIALLPVGWPVVVEMLRSWGSGSVMNEFTLMVAACVGAFIIGEYPEGVAVLLFYSFGEKLEETASGKARGRIRSLIDKLPDKVIVEHPDGRRHTCAPADVTPGEIIVVKPGERVALDGVVEGEREALFDTSALTGESVPAEVAPGGEVSSGYIPVDREVRVKTIRPYTDSAMNRIMRMIEDAASKKSHSETLLRRITRWYTPAVMIAAVALFAGAWVASLIWGEPELFRRYRQCLAFRSALQGEPLSRRPAVGRHSAARQDGHHHHRPFPRFVGQLCQRLYVGRCASLCGGSRP